MQSDRKRQTSAKLSVGILPLPEFTLLPLSGLIDTLRLAADDADRSRQIHCRWTIIGASREAVRSSSGIEITPWEILPEPALFDYLVVAGGLLRGHAHIHPDVPDYLRRAAACGTPLVGLCTGSFVLARSGLLRNRRACIHRLHLDDFRQQFPDIEPVVDKIYVFDRGRITCAGGAGGIDLAVELVRRHCGSFPAVKSLRQMLVDQVRDHDHPQPLSDAEDLSHIHNTVVRRAIMLMEQHLSDMPSIDEIAERLGTNERRLHRLFVEATGTPPGAFSRMLRLRHGQWLVANTARQITEISLECGFADASHFVRAYRQAFGIPPKVDRGRRRGTPSGPGIFSALSNITTPATPDGQAPESDHPC